MMQFVLHPFSAIASHTVSEHRLVLASLFPRSGPLQCCARTHRIRTCPRINWRGYQLSQETRVGKFLLLFLVMVQHCGTIAQHGVMWCAMSYICGRCMNILFHNFPIGYATLAAATSKVLGCTDFPYLCPLSCALTR